LTNKLIELGTWTVEKIPEVFFTNRLGNKPAKHTGPSYKIVISRMQK